ncbi:MAG TPA: DUF11 domain-containing protein, partial [Blastocatellia bacterium]|nr:DUF11 domain-containing protein [Blastocatellia bacterium]
MSCIKNKKKTLVFIAVAMISLVGSLAIFTSIFSPAAASARANSSDVEAARLAFEQARDNEFQLQASGQSESAIRDAAVAADAALRAYNDAVASNQGLTLSLPLVASPQFIPEVENNNPLTGGTAQFLDISPAGEACAIVDAAINPDGDIDVFRVNAPSGSRLWVYVDTGGPTNPGSESRNSTVRVLRSDASIIETDFDDGTGNGLDLTTETETASAIGGVVLSGSADNNYFIEVNEFLFNNVIDPYRLFVVVTNTAPTAENNTANNTRATADVLVPAGQTLGLRTGAVSSGTDVDWYSIEGVQTGDVIYVNLGAVVGRNHVVDFFLPGNATTTPDFTANSAGLGIVIVEPPAEAFAFLATTPGTYQIRVRRVPVVVIIPIDFGPGTYDIMTALCRFADLEITKSDSPDPVIAGEQLTYNITVTNHGPAAAQNVVISDTLPSNTRLVSFTPSMGGLPASSVEMDGTTTVSATFPGATAPGAQRSMTVVVRVCPEVACNDVISNTATTDSDTTDPGNFPNSATATTTVQTRSELSIVKTTTPQIAVAGCTVTFNLTIVNLGPSNSINTVVTDMLPAGFIVQTITTTQGMSSGVGTGTATVNLGTLGAPNQCTTTFNSVAFVQIVASVPVNQPPGNVTNTASVSSGSCVAELNTVNNTSSSMFVVFDISLQDESNGSQAAFRSDTGDYIICCGNGTSRSGRGTITRRGGDITLFHNAGTHRVNLQASLVYKKGKGSLQTGPGLTICTIRDDNIFNNTLCSCAAM